MIISSCFNPVKPPALALTAVAIPAAPIIISTVLFGKGAFRRTGLALKLIFVPPVAPSPGKFAAPFCLTPLTSLIPNVVTVPIPAGKSTPLTCIASPSANLPYFIYSNSFRFSSTDLFLHGESLHNLLYSLIYSPV